MVDKMKIVTRSFYYVRIAAGISSFPLTLLTFATVIYYNLVANTVFLKEFFPHFWMFIIVSFICLYALLGIFGYYWRKKSEFWTAERDVDVETDPYQTSKLAPLSIPMWENFAELFEKNGIDTSIIRGVIEKSKR